jgi:hypothetical protein
MEGKCRVGWKAYLRQGVMGVAPGGLDWSKRERGERGEQ